MPELKGSKTHENLRVAFAKEAQTKQRYLYYAMTAEIEGYGEIAQLLRELAELEVQHVDGHLDLLRRVGDPMTGLGVGDTGRNLSSLMQSEKTEAADMYPAMARTALSEGFPDIADWFGTLAKAKKSHLAELEESRKRVNR